MIELKDHQQYKMEGQATISMPDVDGTGSGSIYPLK